MAANTTKKKGGSSLAAMLEKQVSEGKVDLEVPDERFDRSNKRFNNRFQRKYDQGGGNGFPGYGGRDRGNLGQPGHGGGFNDQGFNGYQDRGGYQGNHQRGGNGGGFNGFQGGGYQQHGDNGFQQHGGGYGHQQGGYHNGGGFNGRGYRNQGYGGGNRNYNGNRYNSGGNNHGGYRGGGRSNFPQRGPAAQEHDFDNNPEWADDGLTDVHQQGGPGDSSLNWQQQKLLTEDFDDPFRRLVRGEGDLSRE